MVAIMELGLRGLQLFLTILITALIGNVVHDAFSGNPSSVNYALFVAIFSWLVDIFAIAALFMEAIAIPIALIAVDALACFFTFIAGVVLAAKLGVHSCGNKGYTYTNQLTNGSTNPGKRCHELQASTAFFWFLFLAYLASLAMIVLRHRGSGVARSSGGPSMTQV